MVFGAGGGKTWRMRKMMSISFDVYLNRPNSLQHDLSVAVMADPMSAITVLTISLQEQGSTKYRHYNSTVKAKQKSIPTMIEKAYSTK